MTITSSDINPMDWHNTKFLTHIPDHFVKVKFNHETERARVLAWLQDNTVGRFAIESVTSEGSVRTFLVNEDVVIGFEDPAEATMYTMFFR